MAPPNLATKLGIQPGMTVALLDPPAEAAQAIRSVAPPAVRWRRRLGSGGCDLVFFWPTETDGLRDAFAMLQKAIVPDGAVWAVLPKKAFAPGRGVSMTWDEMQAEGLRGDLVDNKVAAITATDYGTRFVIRKDRRGK
jgi:hypothetical protein